MSLLDSLIRLIATTVWPHDSADLIKRLNFAHAAYRNLGKCILPQTLVSALIVAEDHRFYLHRGLDLLAILRAVWYCCYRRRLVGGSTLEQQLIRTLTGKKERTLKRKLKEMVLTSCVGVCIPKSEVPGVYLSVAYFGWRMNGVHQACERLGIETTSMTTRQAAEVVARLKYPEPCDPTVSRANQILRRRNYIVERLYSLPVPQSIRIAGLSEGETVLFN